MSGIPTTELVLAILALLSLPIVIWAIVDVSRRPRWQMPAGRKAFWIILLLVGWLLVWPAALISALMYLTVLRRRLDALAVGPAQGLGPWNPYGSPPGVPPVPPPPPRELPPAGWYRDPSGLPAQQRWWDGRGWTDHLRSDPAAFSSG